MENTDKRIQVLDNFETLQKFLRSKFIGDININQWEIMDHTEDPFISGKFDNGYGEYKEYWCKFVCDSFGIKITYDGRPLSKTEYIVSTERLAKWFSSYQQFRIELFERKIEEWQKK